MCQLIGWAGTNQCHLLTSSFELHLHQYMAALLLFAEQSFRHRSHLEEFFITSCILDKILSIIVTPSTSVVDFFTKTNHPIGWL